jgi:hypothetical protein
MAPKIQHKRSAVAGKAPLPADLEYGEIAVNYEATDPALYIKDSADAIRKIGNQPAATETVAGIVELATAAETTTGTDATRAVHPAGLKVELDKKANLASPTFTGTPAAPTAAVGTNTTQVATTAFVHAADKWTRTGTTLSPATAGDTIQGQLVPTNGSLGFRNVIINGELNVNQRQIAIAAAAVGAYGPDRWKKVDATNMTQIVEDANFTFGAKYTLSWKGGTPQVLTAPATGHWTLPNIPITATEIQLELGEVATPFERSRSYGQELALCQRYYEKSDCLFSTAAWSSIINVISWKVTKREAPVVTAFPSGGSGGTFSPYFGASNVSGAFQNASNSAASSGYITASCEL